MADPDLGLRMGGGGGQFCFDTLPSFCPSLIPSFFTKIRGGGGGGGSPRSTTVYWSDDGWRCLFNLSNKVLTSYLIATPSESILIN